MLSSEPQALWTVMLVMLAALMAFFKVQRAFIQVRQSFLDDVQQELKASPLRAWIIGGMMGSGKSTFARSLAEDIGVPHIEIDIYPSEDGVLEHITSANDGWIAEANPWQIPAALAKEADILVFLDYDNTVNYVRLLKRGYEQWRAQGFSWSGFKRSIIDRTILDLGRIVFLYGRANRQGWREAGLLQSISDMTYLRCISPAELEILRGVVLSKRLWRAGSTPYAQQVRR